MPSMPRGQRYFSDPTLIQVLSLYLLLLAFFVILFNISKAEQFKTTVVTDSLNSTFASRGQATQTPERLTSALGSIVSDPAFQRRMGDLITAEMPISEVREIKPGIILEARVPVDALFKGDDVAPDRWQFTESLAAVLAGALPGMHYDVNVLVGVTGATESESDVKHRSLSIVRAGPWRLPISTRKPRSADSARSIPSVLPSLWLWVSAADSNSTASAASAPRFWAAAIRSESRSRCLSVSMVSSDAPPLYGTRPVR